MKKTKKNTTVDLNLGSFSHAHCYRCKHTGEIDKFGWRKSVIVASEGLELIQLRLICPICSGQDCEGLFPHDVN